MKNFFSIRLYREGLRRTKNLMIALSIVALIWVGIAFVSNVTAFKEANNPIFTAYTSIISTTSYLLPFYMFVMGAGFALSAFYFLNKRNECDFLHAIPYSRLSVFVSFALACITWITAIILVAMLIPAVGSSIVGMDYQWGFFLRAFLTSITGTLLVFSATTFAMSITGTAFSNLITTAIVLLLPRFILTAAGLLIADKVQIVSINHMGVFINPMYNIPIGTITGLFGASAEAETMYTTFAPCIYTFCLSVIYFAVSAILFKKRKSEMAGNSAPGKVLQTVYRCCVGLVFALVFTGSLIMGYDDYIGLAVLFALSIVPFFLFELITSRSIKSAGKAMPTYGFVVIACVLFFATVTIASNVTLNITPSADEISSVQCTTDYNDFDYDRMSFSEYKAANVKIKDEDAVKLASDALCYTVDCVKGDISIYDYDSSISQNSIKFNLKNGMTITRSVRFRSASEYNRFYNIIKSDAAYVEAATYLPEYKEFSKVYIEGLTDAETEKLWNCYYSEAKETGNVFSSLTKFTYEMDYSGDANLFVFRTIMYTDSRYFSDIYFVPIQSMPKTTALYIQTVADKPETKDNFNHFLAQIGENDTLEYADYTLNIINTDYLCKRISELGYAGGSEDDILHEALSAYSSFDGMTMPEKFADAFEGAKITTELSDTTVRFTYYEYLYNREKDFTIYVDLTPEGFDKLLSAQHSYYAEQYYATPE